jgi:two-component system LytT family response regulator
MEDYPQIALCSNDGTVFVREEDILYALADGNYTQIHLTHNRTVKVLRKLKEVNQLLVGNNFIRIHRSHLINLKHIQSYDDAESICMNDGKSLAVARHRKSGFLEKFTRI